MIEIERIAQPTNPEEEAKFEMLEALINSEEFINMLRRVKERAENEDQSD